MRAPPPSPLSATINTKRGRSPSIWARALSTWGTVKQLIHPVPGNDEYDTPDASGYFQYFGAAADPAGASYYSYQLGPWHIIALNSNCSDLGCIDSIQGQVTSAELH